VDIAEAGAWELGSALAVAGAVVAGAAVNASFKF
jgi:hypothetical protein